MRSLVVPVPLVRAWLHGAVCKSPKRGPTLFFADVSVTFGPSLKKESFAGPRVCVFVLFRHASECVCTGFPANHSLWEGGVVFSRLGVVVCCFTQITPERSVCHAWTSVQFWSAVRFRPGGTSVRAIPACSWWSGGPDG